MSGIFRTQQHVYERGFHLDNAAIYRNLAALTSLLDLSIPQTRLNDEGKWTPVHREF